MGAHPQGWAFLFGVDYDEGMIFVKCGTPIYRVKRLIWYT